MLQDWSCPYQVAISLDKVDTSEASHIPRWECILGVGDDISSKRHLEPGFSDWVNFTSHIVLLALGSWAIFLEISQPLTWISLSNGPLDL